MSFTAPQLDESRIQFSQVPQDIDIDIEIEQGQDHINVQDIINNIVIESYNEQGFDWDALEMVLRWALIGTLLIGLALRHRPLDNPSDPVAPRIFLDSFRVPHFKVSNGELLAKWNVKLTVSNAVNGSNINILRLHAAVTYKGNETLAVVNAIMPQYALEGDVFGVGAGEKKGMVLSFSVTGWEKEQPVVDDTVVQAIAEDMVRGGARFGLRMEVTGEVEVGDGWMLGFSMYPVCNGLDVGFLAGGQKKEGKAAAATDGKPRECVGHVEWGPAS